MPSQRRLVAAACAAVAAMATGPASAEPGVHATLSNDNDFWAFRGTDQDYSNGLELDVRIAVEPRWGFRRALAGVAIGEAFYSPPDIEETNPAVLRADRPYAGWLWTAARVEGFGRGMRTGAELRAGVVGPHAFGEQIQIAWHSWNRAPRPLGWPVTQVDDRADVALSLWSSVDVVRLRWAGVTLEPACEAGSVRAACTLSAFARVGLLRDDRTAVPRLSAPIAPPWGATPSRKPVELFVFFGASARVVALDKLLEGEVRTSDDGVVPGWVERRCYGAELHAGVAATWRGWSLAFSQIARSSDIRAPVGADRTQRFGRVVLGHAW